MHNQIFSLANQNVKELTPFKPGKPIDDLRRELKTTNIIKLASNENPLGPSKLAIEAIKNSLQDLKFYPDANGFELKAILANRLHINPNQITLGNGSEDVMNLLALTFASNAHEIITSQHEFITYSLISQKVGAKSVIVPTKNWGYDLELMSAAVNENTRLLFIANAKNPTGTRIDTITLRNFLDTIPKTVLVILDEAYCDYITEADHPNGIELLNYYPNIIVTRTFSKIHGLASLRIGYGVSSPEIADLLNRVKMPFNVNRLGLVAAAAAIQDDEHISHSLEVNRDGMKQLQDAFNEMRLNYLPSFGNFITIELGHLVQQTYQTLLANGIIVRPLDSCGMPNHLRVTIGLQHQNDRFIQSLKKILSTTIRHA